MIYIISFVFMFMAFARADNVASKLQEKTVADQNAKYGEFPYQVSVRIFNQHICAGAIITNKFVVTAAHCVDIYKEVPFNIKAVIGSLKLSRPIFVYYANKIIVHDKFNRTTGENNIALIKIRNRFIFSGLVNAIRLPNTNHTLTINQTVIVTGWSRIYFNGYISDHLQRVKLAVASFRSCKSIYNTKLTAKFLFITLYKKPEVCINNGPFHVRTHQNFCAHDPNVKQGTCQFDSGSALTDNGVLVGLISWGDPLYCGGTDFPVVCTQISYYVNWINENIL